MMRRGVRRGGVGLLGAAAIGGTAYAVGKSAQRNDYREQSQEARLNELESQQSYPPPPQQQYAPPPQPQYAPPPPPAASPPPDRVQQLKDLADLKTAGVLSDAEFEKEKARILSS
jgi:hypothetical protein